MNEYEKSLIGNEGDFLINIIDLFKSIPIESHVNQFEYMVNLTNRKDEKISMSGYKFVHSFSKTDSEIWFNVYLQANPGKFFGIDIGTYMLKVEIFRKNPRSGYSAGTNSTKIDTFYYDDDSPRKYKKEIKEIYDFVRQRHTDIKNYNLNKKYVEYNSAMDKYIDKNIKRDSKLEKILDKQK